MLIWSQGHSNMVGHLFQNYDTICVRLFPTYTCDHSCYTIYVRFLQRMLAFFTASWGFYSQVYGHFLANAHIYAHKKKPIYMRYKQACVYGVTESRRIRGTELYRQQKTPSCTMELKSNLSLNQAWPQWPR